MPKTRIMIELLKTHLQNKAVDKIIALLHANPEVLGLEDDHGSSGLTLIAYSGLEKAFVEAIDLKKSFSFHEAIVCGKLKIVKDYMKTPDFDLADTHSNDGFTPLSLAAFFNRTEIAKALIALGADPNLSAKNPSKVNALHAAIAKENYELCKLFIENGANVNAVQMKNVTPLHAAVHRGNLTLVKLLVDNRALITTQMDNGDTALLIAEREKHDDILAYLLGEQH